MFLDANLPTMLAPGNLPALFVGVDCEYLIYTTEQDAALMMQNAAFRRLNSLMTVSLKLFRPSKTMHPVALQTEIWQEATAHARSRASFVLFMPPDVAWATAALRRCGPRWERASVRFSCRIPASSAKQSCPFSLNVFLTMGTRPRPFRRRT